jgi:lipoprotein NlpD
VAAALVTALLAGCASPTHRAPVEERKPVARVAPAASPSPVQPAAAQRQQVASSPAEAAAARLQLPGWENAGKPGYYTVKAGDTLIRIGLDHGQNWRDVARWSGLDNPNLIEIGQVLRIAPPNAVLPLAPVAVTTPSAAGAPTGAASKPLMPSGTVESRPLDGAGHTVGGGAASTTPGAVSAASVSTPGAPAAPSSAAASTAAGAAVSGPAAAVPPASGTPLSPGTATARESDDELSWSWPAAGPVLSGFDEVKSKGLAISGRAGDPVLAAADGRVVYSGSGLRGYGNLIIVKHNATYLTAYAHNQTLLVKDDQAVRRGQKIAEMGSSDTDRVQLHFEIRRLGKPVDPARLLPAR